MQYKHLLCIQFMRLYTDMCPIYLFMIPKCMTLFNYMMLFSVVFPSV